MQSASFGVVVQQSRRERLGAVPIMPNAVFLRNASLAPPGATQVRQHCRGRHRLAVTRARTQACNSPTSGYNATGSTTRTATRNAMRNATSAARPSPQRRHRLRARQRRRGLRLRDAAALPARGCSPLAHDAVLTSSPWRHRVSAACVRARSQDTWRRARLLHRYIISAPAAPRGHWKLLSCRACGSTS